MKEEKEKTTPKPAPAPAKVDPRIEVWWRCLECGHEGHNHSLEPPNQACPRCRTRKGFVRATRREGTETAAAAAEETEG